ncbi:MAG: flagellin lysine-N-methylase [Peptostreptococcaceae bacterium]|nr:flagellin lysine-N-methylase [Peptostreptococcaceae bacterium]
MKTIRIMRMASYLNEFKCIGGVCEDNCCIGWSVEIDKKTFLKYRNLKDVELKKIVNKYVYKNEDYYDSKVDYGLVELKKNKHCPFLNDKKLCRLQAKLGEKYLSNVCAGYPRLINEVNGVLEYSATVSCPEIARLALATQEGIEFEEKNATIFKDDIINIYVNAINNDNHVYVKYLQELRDLTIDILKSRKYPLWERILIIGLVFQRVQEFTDNNAVEKIPEQIKQFAEKMNHQGFKEELGILPVNQSKQLEILKDISDKFNDSNEIDSKKYLAFINEFYQGIGVNKYDLLYNDFYKPFMDEKEYILENYLVNYVFQSLFPAAESNQPFMDYEQLVIRYSLIKLYLIGISGFRKGLTESLVIEFIQSFSKGLEHNYSFFEKISEYMQQKNYDTMAYTSILIRN